MEEEKCPKVLPSNTVIKFAEGQHVIYNPIVTAYFRNGKRGCIVGRKEGEGDYQFRFYNVERDEDLSCLPDKITDEDFERRQILAVSFLGYWLYFQGEKKLDTIMQDFYEIDKQNYIHLARVNFGMSEKEASRDYIQRVYYEREERDSHYKERLFEYLSVDNQKIIEGVLLDYRNYLSRRLEIEYPEYMLDWINNTNQAEFWNNGTFGWIHSYNSLHEYDGDYILSFQSVDWKRSDGRLQPEIAKGFVAYWIYIKENRPTNIFENYYRFKLEKYKKEHQGDFDYSFREEKIELEFIEKHIEEEERFIALSQLHLYSYLNNGCVALIEDDVKKYREFLKLRHNLLKKIYPQPTETKTEEAKSSSNTDDTSIYCYKYENEYEDNPNAAIQKFTTALQNDGLLDKSIEVEQMLQLFGGKRCEYTFKWLSNNLKVLSLIIKRLKYENLIEARPKKNEIWKVLSARFVDSKGKPMPDLRHENEKPSPANSEMADKYIKLLR